MGAVEFSIVNFHCFDGGIFHLLKFGYSEKATKFEKIFHLKFDATQIEFRVGYMGLNEYKKIAEYIEF